MPSDLRVLRRERDILRDPALETILSFVSIDEAAHFGLFRQFFELFLKFDREPALAALRPVLNQFQMPAIHDLLDENKRRIAEVRDYLDRLWQKALLNLKSRIEKPHQ